MTKKRIYIKDMEQRRVYKGRFALDWGRPKPVYIVWLGLTDHGGAYQLQYWDENLDCMGYDWWARDKPEEEKDWILELAPASSLIQVRLEAEFIND